MLKFVGKPAKAYVNKEIFFKMVVQTPKAKKVAADCHLDWGDGNSVQTGTDTLIKHIYRQPGKFTINASVSLKESEAYSPPLPESTDITVTVDPPDISLSKSTPTGGVPGYNFIIKAEEGSYPVGNWTLSFGDGKSETGQGKGSKTINHVYSKPGTYKVEFSVTDSTGTITKKSLNVTKTAP